MNSLLQQYRDQRWSRSGNSEFMFVFSHWFRPRIVWTLEFMYSIHVVNREMCMMCIWISAQLTQTLMRTSCFNFKHCPRLSKLSGPQWRPLAVWRNNSNFSKVAETLPGRSIRLLIVGTQTFLRVRLLNQIVEFTKKLEKCGLMSSLRESKSQWSLNRNESVNCKICNRNSILMVDEVSKYYLQLYQ